MTKLISICILISMSLYAQNDNEHTFKFHSFSITPLEVFFTDNDGGFAITGELSYASNKNIFTFSASAGETLALWGRGDRFQQLNILYGRELKLKKRLFIEGHAGVGLFFYSPEEETHFSEIGFPLVGKFRFKTGDKFSFGLKFHGNINAVKNIYSIGFILQWNY